MNEDQAFEYWDGFRRDWKAYIKQINRYRTNITYRLWLTLPHHVRDEVAVSILVGGKRAAFLLYGWEVGTAVMRYHPRLKRCGESLSA